MFLDIDVKGVTCNYKKVKPGYVFVDVTKDALSSNQQIKYALERGAAAVYTGNNLSFLPEGIPVIKVGNPRKTLAKLLSKFYGYPSEKLNVIGITGTNGKTTTSHMIAYIFKRAGYKTGLIDNVNVIMDDEKYPGKPGYYDTEMLQELLARMVEKKVYAAVLEVSGHQLQNNEVDGIDFNVAVHTVISREQGRNQGHDCLDTMKGLFDMLPAGGTAVINTDDPSGLALVKQNPKPLILTYGLGTKATITASSIEIANTGITYTCCIQRSFTNMLGNDIELQEIPIKLKVAGKHNVYNSLAATAVALMYGIKEEVIQEALKDFNGVWRRMQVIREYDFTVVDSFTNNPASFEAVFETVQSMDYNNLFIIVAVMGNGGVKVNGENAKIIRHWASLLGAKEIIVTRSSDAVGEGHSVSREEEEAFRQGIAGGGTDIKYCDTLEEAVLRALSKVNRGDMVIFMGAEEMNRAQDMLADKLTPKSS